MNKKTIKIPISFKLSMVLAAISLVAALYIRTNSQDIVKPWGYMLLGFWALAPPVWFLFEFTYRLPKQDDKRADEMSRLKHLHDLSRNIWLAFIVVLAAIMGVGWPP